MSFSAFLPFLAAGSSALGSLMSYNSQKKLMDRQNSFTERMSNTAHQREVNDLRSAGLNPVLSATGGSGASTPASGTGASDLDIADAVNSALRSKEVNLQEKMNKAQVDNYKADTYLKGNQAAVASEQFNTQVEETNKIKQDIINSTNTANATVQYYKDLGDAAKINAASNSALSAAQTKYTNERSRGYSESESDSFGGSFNLGGKFGLSGNKGRSRSRTY